MSSTAHFVIDPRLASVLGESYRRSADALKELVDNAWDADAETVSISMPDRVSLNDAALGPVVVEDDGSGMTEAEVRTCYLRVAHSRSHRTSGPKTIRFQRRIKGRKGIGKFAGMVVADGMSLVTWANGKQTSISIQKADLIKAAKHGGNLEGIDLNISVDECHQDLHGTKVTLSPLTINHLPPSKEDLCHLLYWEYGRAPGFKISVNGNSLNMESFPGDVQTKNIDLGGGATAVIRYQISDVPFAARKAGLYLRINGKVAGQTQWFGLDQDEEIPEKVRRCVVGEIEVDGVDASVIAADGSIFDESKIRAVINRAAQNEIGGKLKQRHQNAVNLGKARLAKMIKEQVGKLPEYRRKNAEEHLSNILDSYYPEMADRTETLVWVALESMEKADYWAVCQALREISGKDVEAIASALNRFGLADMAYMQHQVHRRLEFLDRLEALAKDDSTLERHMHEAIKQNSWIFGQEYECMASESTLKNIIERHCDTAYAGSRADKRPDLLLWSDDRKVRILVEFKRPSLEVGRQAEAQAKTYADELGNELGQFKVIVVGGKVDSVMKLDDSTNLQIRSYFRVIQEARNRLEWLMRHLSNDKSSKF